MTALTKFIKKMIAGEPKTLAVSVDKNLLNQFRYAKKNLEDYELGYGLWKEFRKNPDLIKPAYEPGGIFDPVDIAKWKKQADDRALGELKDKIMGKYTPDEFSQFKGKKQVDKAVSLVEGIKGIFEPDDITRHLSKGEIAAKLRQGPSRRDFLAYISDIEDKLPKGTIPDVGNIAEVIDPVGSGMSAVRSRRSEMKKTARKIQDQIESQLPEEYFSKLHEKINQRGKK